MPCQEYTYLHMGWQIAYNYSQSLRCLLAAESANDARGIS